jgi:hypothetical protein
LNYLTVPGAPKAQVPDMYQTRQNSIQAAQQGYDPMAQQIVMGGRQLTNPNDDFYKPRWDTESASTDRISAPMNTENYQNQAKAQKIKKVKNARAD